jgi:hypothetical protein
MHFPLLKQRFKRSQAALDQFNEELYSNDATDILA